MMRRRPDIDDLDESLFSAEEAKRRRVERAEMIENHRKMEEAQAAAAAQRRAEFIEWQQRANDDNLQRGYALAGVEPPTVGPNGTPIVSLALLLSIGWRIEQQADGRNVLVSPPTAERYVAKGESH